MSDNTTPKDKIIGVLREFGISTVGRFDRLADSILAALPPIPAQQQGGCSCAACEPNTIHNLRMILCAKCGNKRCPHASDHRNECTGSNEPGQRGTFGSSIPFAPCNIPVQPNQEPVGCGDGNTFIVPDRSLAPSERFILRNIHEGRAAHEGFHESGQFGTFIHAHAALLAAGYVTRDGEITQAGRQAADPGTTTNTQVQLCRDALAETGRTS